MNDYVYTELGGVPPDHPLGRGCAAWPRTLTLTLIRVEVAFLLSRYAGSSRYATRERKEAKQRKASQAENAATAKSLPPAPNALSRRRSTSIIARNGDAERMLGNKGKAR